MPNLEHAPLVHPQQQRVLIGFIRRLRARALADAEGLVRREMSGIVTTGGAIVPRAIPPLGGDVTGALGSNTAIKIQGIPVSSDDPTTNQVLKYNGSQWAPATDAGLVNPMTTAEDLIKGGASGTPVRLAVGTTGYVLKVVAGAVAWAAEIVSALASTVVTETAFGQSSAVGVATTAARGDHTHGTPTNPVTAHEAASDPHTGYQRESEKGAANGYASLGSDTLVPQDQLGTGTQDGTKYLRDDGTWQTVSAGITFDDGATPANLSTPAATGDDIYAARRDHVHLDPVIAHAAAGDPHPGYTTTAELAAALADYILETLIDAKGDLIAGSAADTAARLGVGTDGQILYADSAETTGLRWGDAPTGSTSHWEVLLLDGEPVTLDSAWVYVEVP